MTTIRLLIADQDRCRWLEQLLTTDPKVACVAANSEVDLDWAVGSPACDVAVIDLAHPLAAEPRFWATLHMLHRTARLVALTNVPVERSALGAALQAGATYIVGWSETPARILKVIRAAVDGTGFIPLGPVLEAMCTYFDGAKVTAHTLPVGPHCLDLEQRVLMRDDEPISLTPIEFQLLHYLAARAGQVIGLAELARHVWHQSRRLSKMQAPIKSTIKRLRHKLERNPHDPQILLTVFGHGYYVAKPPQPVRQHAD